MKKEVQDMQPGAAFLGWQEDGRGGQIALFNVLRPGPRCGSTVSAATLAELGIAVPWTPKQRRKSNEAVATQTED